MNLLLQPNSWSCLPTAFAMCIDRTPKDIFDWLEHDGSKIIWPELPDPECRQGFTIEECIHYAIADLIYPIVFWSDIMYAPERGGFQPFNPMEKIAYYMQLKNGIVLCQGDKHGHAVAWNRSEQMVYDPKGFKAPIDEYEILGFIGVF